MELSTISNNELVVLYINYKKQLKIYKQRNSFFDLNKILEIKNYLSLIKWEMKKRGLNKKEAKKYVNI
ncbi:hypothetical protein WQ54_15755 [Bacillus sp. SA1-12]|uniref:hypothetical protein n=1 Tax=Bacillus sp. SA1-12 TaxID=1455638 RepID=UPI000626FC4A|nr:hypothetical protein [Bacillus sp. SA1-12]KKI91276.1 hypothetical protein WQ54_15755 [Bacillus sp. SA1-12]